MCTGWRKWQWQWTENRWLLPSLNKSSFQHFFSLVMQKKNSVSFRDNSLKYNFNIHSFVIIYVFEWDVLWQCLYPTLCLSWQYYTTSKRPAWECSPCLGFKIIHFIINFHFFQTFKISLVIYVTVLLSNNSFVVLSIHFLVITTTSDLSCHVIKRGLYPSEVYIQEKSISIF